MSRAEQSDEALFAWRVLVYAKATEKSKAKPHQTDSLAVAKHYAASLYQSSRVQAVRVVDQITQQVVSNSSDLSGWPFAETD